MAALRAKRLNLAFPWSRGRIRALHPRLALSGLTLPGRRSLAFLAAILPDLLAAELLLGVTGYVYRDAIASALVFHEADTTTMFYPVFAALRSAIGRGGLLLWSPELFTGFPLLAEGQTGVLYPPNWLAAALLPTEAGFIWLRIGHFGLASLLAYLFGRSMRLAPGPAAVMALSWTFGSFLVGQMQHASVLASAVWLPLVLALTELGFRSHGLPRQRYLMLGGLAMGVSALGAHMQPVVMSGGCFVAWVGFRLIFPPSAPSANCSDREARHSRGRLAALRWGGGATWRFARALAGRTSLALWTAGLVPLLAASVAAAQLLPLYELSSESGRAGGWTYQEATDYSLPLPNLITLIFPFFFRDDQGGGWSLWQPWEVTYYAGVVPLALAVLGVLCARRREILFFLSLALVATLLALGDYSPINLYGQVWNWPGMNLQRAPARFSYLGVLGIAGLAGLGSQVLWQQLRIWPNGARPTPRPLFLWVIGLVGGIIVLAWHLVTWRAWLEADRTWALRVIDQQYLSLRRDPGVVDGAQQVFSGLRQSLDLTNPHTALPLLLLAGLLLLAICWNELRRPRLLWQSLLVLLVAVDLASFAETYHPAVPIDTIADVGGAGRFLARQGGLFRAYTDPDVKRPRANQLLPWEVAEARAYDPLELSRHRVLIGSVAYVDNWLLDLLGIRFRVLPAEQPGQPSYRQTAFNPQHPLVSGSSLNPSGVEAWALPGEQADELRVVSVLEDAFGVGESEPVGQWVLTDSSGAERALTMVAGRDTAEWTYDDPAYAMPPAHSRAPVAFAFDLAYPLASGARHVNLYYSAYPLTDRPRLTRAEFRAIHPVARVQIFGFGLFNKDLGRVGQFFEREKNRVVYRDQDAVVEENRAAFPRAYAVPQALVAPDAYAALETLSHGALQPRRQVLLEADDPSLDQLNTLVGQDSTVPTSDRLGAPYGNVTIVDYGDESTTVQVRSEGGYLVLTDAYYPGWRAYLDGQETPILRANYLFRGVALPSGQHLVQFRYQPASFGTGLTITKLTLVLVGLFLLVTLAPARSLVRATWLRTP